MDHLYRAVVNEQFMEKCGGCDSTLHVTSNLRLQSAQLKTIASVQGNTNDQMVPVQSGLKVPSVPLFLANAESPLTREKACDVHVKPYTLKW